ncbi:MAG: hypothetical protein ACREOL_01480 [Candidatus Dormibacteria bacterium]
MGRRLSFLFILAAGPRTEAVETARALAAAAKARGHTVTAFLLGDGVAHAYTLADDLPVVLCDADWRWRQAGASPPSGVHRGSLRDLARLCRESHTVLVFR